MCTPIAKLHVLLPAGRNKMQMQSYGNGKIHVTTKPLLFIDEPMRLGTYCTELAKEERAIIKFGKSFFKFIKCSA